MACGRGQIIKVALVAGFLLILLNLFGGGSRFDASHRFKVAQKANNKNPLQWPKRTHSSYEQGYAAQKPLKNRNSSSNSSSTNSSQVYSVFNYSTTPLYNGPSSNDKIAQTISVTSNNELPSNVHTNLTIDNGETMGAKPTVIKRNYSISQFESDNRVMLSSLSNDFSTTTLPKLAAAQQKHQSPPMRIPAVHARITKFDVEPRPGLFESLMSTFGINMCPQVPTDLDGPIEVDTLYEKLTVVEARLGPRLQNGGWYRPTECKPRYRVAVVVPYRDREQHLPVFLKNIHVFLMKQQIAYGIFIVEQSSGNLFNRAALMNVGFVEALKLNDWDCFVFHDVDLLPLDDRNLYSCPEQPRHLSVAVDTFGYKLPYSSIFGGVSAMTVKQFRTVNGFSNQFWGWGGEDDDMSNRLKHVGYHIARYPINIARYTMLSHNKEKANPKRYEKLVTGAKRFESDGLNSMKYKILALVKKRLYTWIHVELIQEQAS